MRNPTRAAAPPPLDLDHWRDDEEDPSAPSDMAGVFIAIGIILILSWAAYWGLT